ncbi:MAG: Nif3-like dinuclear metal center hexameric protein [Candidatus Thorarchaeota archaeon]
MTEFVHLLDKMIKEFSNINSEMSFVIGKEWYEDTRNNIKKCLITSHLTRKAVATAIQTEVDLIITIAPPIFVINKEKRIPAEKLEILRLLIENRIAIFSFGEKFLTMEKGGFDYFLNLIDFKYSSLFNYNLTNFCNTATSLEGRIGETEKKAKFKDLIEKVQKNLDVPITYYGYEDTLVKKIVILSEILQEELFFELATKTDIDAIIVGDLGYEAKVSVHLAKIPIIIVGRENLENNSLSKIRRMLMEYITVDLPELETLKQQFQGTLYPKK